MLSIQPTEGGTSSLGVESRTSSELPGLMTACRRHELDRAMAGLYLADPVSAEPPTAEKVRAALLAHVETASDISYLERLVTDGRLSELVHCLMLGHPKEWRPNDTTHFLTQQLQGIIPQDALQYSFASSNDALCWPQSSFHTWDASFNRKTQNRSCAIIGGGPAAGICHQTMKRLGCGSGVQTFSPTGSYFGVWKGHAEHAGYINPGETHVFRKALVPVGGRKGVSMQQFLKELTNGMAPIPAMVSHVEPSPDGRARVYYLQNQTDGLRHRDFDSVIITTGNSQEKDLQYGHMETNAHEFEERFGEHSSDFQFIRRRMKPMGDEDLARFHCSTPVIVGLGNSFEFEFAKYRNLREKTGVNINPIVLTHHSLDAVQNPDESFDGRHPIARSRQKMGGYAYDLKRHRDTYNFAESEGAIIPSVRAWFIEDVDQYKQCGTIRVVQMNGEERVYSNVPHVHALVGFQNDPQLLHNLGARTNRFGDAFYNPHTLRVDDNFGHQMPNADIYIFGAAAGGNHSVIPGMNADIGPLMMSYYIDANRPK